MKLTKREAVLLLALLIIAILFVEYQFVYVPGMAKYERLSIENDKAQNEVNEINRLISSMPVIRARKAKALSDVATAGIPFYDQLNTDALLWNTHDLLVKSGMKAVSYSTSELGLALLDANQVKVAEQSYKLRELANAFADAGKAQSSAAATPTPTPTPTPIAAAQNSNEKTGDIEVYSVNISFLGSYDQIRAFITSIESLKKTITVSMLSLESAGTQDQLKGLILINYYGAMKIVTQQDASNIWTLSPYSNGTGSPFGGAGVAPAGQLAAPPR